MTSGIFSLMGVEETFFVFEAQVGEIFRTNYDHPRQLHIDTQ